MSPRIDGQIRRSQVITTYGPGALIDLPEDAAIVGGLETWPDPGSLEEIGDPRLTGLLRILTGVPAPRTYAPPPEPAEPWASGQAIGAWRFPEWFVVQERDRAADAGRDSSASGSRRDRKRRLVHRKRLHRKRFEGRSVTPTRFVRACPRGHVDDLDWDGFVHGRRERCGRRLWLDERGTTGDLADLVVRCACGRNRRLYEATDLDQRALGVCRGRRPWLGLVTNEDCTQPARLLIRTASNAYFPQVVSVLSLPDRGTELDRVVEELWDDLQIVDDLTQLGFIKRKPRVTERLHGFTDAMVMRAIQRRRDGTSPDRSVKEAEIEELLDAPEGFGDDVPVDPDFHARRLPDSAWRIRGSRLSDGVAGVTQLHRLREVLALIGFTRFEAVIRDIHGEYDTDVERAAIALEPGWFPAVENRGEGLFVHLRPAAVKAWMRRPGTRRRIDRLLGRHDTWMKGRRRKWEFPGGPYILVHTLAHLLIQSLAMRCGYPASSIRERVYVEGERYGLLLYTGSPDAEGTLGGLVQQARHFEDHLAFALEMGRLCSNDPICAHHSARAGIEEDRRLLGAACHGCTLIAETSCEMRNDYLDRALVVPVLGSDEAAFFPPS